MMGMSYRVEGKGEDISIDFSYLTVRLPLYFDSGSLAISLDHTTVIHLRPGPSSHRREYAYDTTHSQYVNTEEGYWRISREELKQICDAEYIAIRITAGSEYWELEEDIALFKFRFMCRSFYQSILGDYTYSDWLEAIVPEGTEGQSDGALLIVIGYVFSFLLPVALIIGGYICISRQENFDGEKVSKYSRKARMHAIAMMVMSILLFLWFTRSRWTGA